MKHRVVIDEQLAAMPLFRGLSKRELELVATMTTRVQFEPGKVLTHEGDRGNEVILLLDGTVEIRHDNQVVTTRGASDYVGEIALITNQPRTATVVTTSPVTAEVIARREFIGLLAEVQKVSDRARAGVPDRLAALAT
jgi:CRP/FNR family transcriptional regulator, cyclic AMP receptor protein